MPGGSWSRRVGAIVLVIVARIVAGRDVDDRGARRRAGRTGGDRTSADYWTEARALAGGGNYDAACHALYTAVLDVLARRRRRAHPPVENERRLRRVS